MFSYMLWNAFAGMYLSSLIIIITGWFYSSLIQMIMTDKL